jgi:capsular exopolysaccharide synthesis family protein
VLPVAKRWPRASATPARLAERSNGTERRLRNPLAAHLPWRRRPLEPLSILPIRDERLAPVAVAASLHRFRDGFRALRANLGFVDSDGALIVAVTSAVRGEGKSTVAANLALAEAQAGRRVVLVDADMREPRLHQFFGLSNAYGLSTVLSRNANEAGLHVQTGPLGMHILTSGPTPPDPAGLLDSPRMAQLMRAFHAQADITILDSPSILDAPDAIVLQQHVHGLIVVIDIQHTPFKALDHALASLQPAKALGTVLNRVKQHASRRGRYGPEAHRESLPIETPESAHDAPVVLSAPPEQARGWRGSGGADS